jgi:hypothetical protein
MSGSQKINNQTFFSLSFEAKLFKLTVSVKFHCKVTNNIFFSRQKKHSKKRRRKILSWEMDVLLCGLPECKSCEREISF